jgi:integrase
LENLKLLATPICHPYIKNMTTNHDFEDGSTAIGGAKTTRQLLDKIPNFPCLYRHSLNGTYYAIKKHEGKRKEHSLQTTDRKIAERKLADWIKGLDKLDVEAEKTTLATLLDKFTLAYSGKASKTVATNASIIKRFKETWTHGLDIRVSKVKPSHLDEWLAVNSGDWKHSTYNRYAMFFGQLFAIAKADKMIVESPFDGVKTRWKKPQKPQRFVPTQEQFQAIVNDIRAQKFNAEAEDSADFVEFLGLAGLGQAEAGSLTWGDVDWVKGVLRIKRHKTHERFEVPIYDWLRPLLERLAKSNPNANPDTNVFKIKDAKKALAAACARLQLKAYSQRNIRAVLIRRLWRARVDVKLIAKWQGHQDGGKLILNTYTEVFGDNDAEYVKAELAKVQC